MSRNIFQDDQAEGGRYYSDQISIIYQQAGLDGETMYLLSPDDAYQQIHEKITGLLSGRPGDDPRLSLLLKTGIKGLLISFGDQLLTAMMGTAEHPRLPKKVDVLAWYSDMFTRIALAHLLQQETVIRGEETKEPHVRKILEISSRPVAPSPQNPPRPGE